MRFLPYLYFDGDCGEAFAFYREVTGGEIATLEHYRGSPVEAMVGPEWLDEIFHATLVMGDHELLGSDVVPGNFQGRGGCAVMLEVDTPDAAERAFARLADGGVVAMAPQETFWTKRFGMVRDRFGVDWMVDCA